MADHGTGHWQEPGTAWKGAGLYHITMTIPSREPLFGALVIPDDVTTVDLAVSDGITELVATVTVANLAVGGTITFAPADSGSSGEGSGGEG